MLSCLEIDSPVRRSTTKQLPCLLDYRPANNVLPQFARNDQSLSQLSFVDKTGALRACSSRPPRVIQPLVSLGRDCHHNHMAVTSKMKPAIRGHRDSSAKQMYQKSVGIIAEKLNLTEQFFLAEASTSTSTSFWNFVNAQLWKVSLTPFSS